MEFKDIAREHAALICENAKLKATIRCCISRINNIITGYEIHSHDVYLISKLRTIEKTLKESL